MRTPTQNRRPPCRAGRRRRPMHTGGGEGTPPAIHAGWKSILAAAAALTVLAGCATVEHPTANRTVRSLRETQTAAQSAHEQIDGTIQLLNDLITAPQEDLRPLYQRLVREMERIEGEAERAAQAAAQYRDYAFQHDRTWTADLKSTEDSELHRLRSRTQETTRAHFREIEQAATAVRTGYWVVLEDIRGIARHLEQDLTAAGVRAIEPLFIKTKEDALDLRAALDRFITALDDTVAALSPRAASAAGSTTRVAE